MRKLNVQKLENRIAPGYGLFSFLSGLAQQDSDFGSVFNQLVDADTGEVDVDAAAGVANEAGIPVAPVQSSFTLSDDVVISNDTASKILSIFGK